MAVTGGQRAAAASVQPMLECVWQDGADPHVYEAVWGYNNTSSTMVALPIGASNGFSPEPADRGQGTSFLPGSHDNTMVTPWDGNGTLKWTLDAGTAVAKKNSSACEAPPISMPADVGIDPLPLFVFIFVASGIVVLGWVGRRARF